MTDRYHYFSYLESAAGGELVLDNPFERGYERAAVCRYDLRGAGKDVLSAHPRQRGLAAFGRLLPLPEGDVLSEAPVFELRPREHHPGDACASLQALHYPAALLYELPFAMAARNNPFRRGFCVADDPLHRIFTEHDRGAFLQDRRLLLPQGAKGFRGSIELALAAMRRDHPHWCDFSAWGNPFRAEALKTIGLGLAALFPDAAPTLVVHDPTGELVHALILASQHYRHFYPDTLPYRIVLVQVKPYHVLCQRFEGGAADWTPLHEPANRSYLKPPEPLLDGLIRGLLEHRGTAVALENPGADQTPLLFEETLLRLTRTGFVDEEDHLILMSAV